jgi:hypothetical protein
VAGVVLWAAYKVGRNSVREEARERARKQNEEEIALGTLGPIAAMMVTGRITPERADREVRQSAIITPAVMPLWDSMSQEEREELGRNMLQLYDDPTFVAKQTALVNELKSADPQLWRSSEEAVQKSLGPTPTGGQA